MGTKSSFSIFNSDGIIKRYGTNNLGGMKLGCLMYLSSLVGLVPSGDRPGTSPRKLLLYNCTNAEILSELIFPATIRHCLMNKRHIVVGMNSEVHVYNMRTLTLLGQLVIAKHSPIALSIDHPTLLAIASANKEGGWIALFSCAPTAATDIEITEAISILCEFKAHKSSVSCIQISKSGKYVASSSSTGTIIRVYDVSSSKAVLVCSHRRGVSVADVSFMSFCPLDRFLAVVSSSGTIHVFQLLLSRSNSVDITSTSNQKSADSTATTCSHDSDIISFFQSTMNQAQAALLSITSQTAAFVVNTNIIPTDFFDPSRADFICRIPAGETQCKVALVYPRFNKSSDVLIGESDSQDVPLPKLLVVTNSGYFYRCFNYSITYPFSTDSFTV